MSNCLNLGRESLKGVLKSKSTNSQRENRRWKCISSASPTTKEQGESIIEQIKKNKTPCSTLRIVNFYSPRQTLPGEEVFQAYNTSIGQDRTGCTFKENLKKKKKLEKCF